MGYSEDTAMDAFNELMARTERQAIDLSLTEADFLRFLIQAQLEHLYDEEGLIEATNEVADMMQSLATRLLDLFSPLVWVEYQDIIGPEIIEPPA